jgi:hypothetical protein
LNNPRTYVANLKSDLKHQALDATMGHAQAAVTPTDAQLTQIVSFEAALNSAQAVDATAGRLDSDGASDGPRLLSQTAFFPGINDSIGGDPTGAAFRPNAFTLYSNWKKSPDPNKRSVARGEDIFNTHPLLITNVGVSMTPHINRSLQAPARRAMTHRTLAITRCLYPWRSVPAVPPNSKRIRRFKRR